MDKANIAKGFFLNIQNINDTPLLAEAAVTDAQGPALSSACSTASPGSQPTGARDEAAAHVTPDVSGQSC